MNHQVIEEHDLIGGFVANQLSDEDRMAFEDHFMSCPTCLADLEREQAFAAGTQQVFAEQVVQQTVVTGIAAWFATRNRALAVLATFALLIGVLVFRPVSFQASGAAGVLPQANVPLVALAPTRSTNSTAAPNTRFQVSAQQGYVVFALEVSTPQLDGLRVVFRQAERVVWQTTGLQVDGNGELVMALPAAFVPVGDYQVELYANDQLAHVYSFRVLE